MNAIIGMTHLCLQTELTSQQHGYMEKVDQASRSLLGIINDVLDVSKIEAGKMEIESIDFRLEDVLDNLRNVVGLKAQQKGLELLFNIDTRIPAVLVGDPLRLDQVLVNLTGNAVKFTDSGEVVVSANLIAMEEGYAVLEFSVRDTGIGLTEAQQNSLFQSFTQADTSTTRKYGGSGLGLTISKYLVEKMGGRIWFESEPDVGSTFSIQAKFGLPTKPQEQQFRPSDDLFGLRVLVVDDNAASREIFKQMLEALRFDVSLVSSGAEAISEIEMAEATDTPYQLILMDWKMPGMDGIEATHRIRANDRILRVPTIIMVTAYGAEEVIQQADKTRLDGLLTKPVSPSVLLDSVIQAFDKEFPEMTRTATQQTQQLEAVSKLKGARILLVEDNEINQELAFEILSSAGILVSLANNGQEALDILKHDSFDGVLMDLQMPEMDGYTATRRIRQRKEYDNLPILAMTANAMAGDREKSLEVGMNDHIAKPINVTNMFTTLAKWITPTKPTGPRMGSVSIHDNYDSPLPDIEGLDTEAGLHIAQGNRRLYQKLLIKFRDDQRDFARRFHEARISDDVDAATRYAHTLKGVAGNIGATALQEVAFGLENMCTANESGDAIEQQLGIVEKQLTSITVGVGRVFASGIRSKAGSVGERDCRQGQAYALTTRVTSTIG